MGSLLGHALPGSLCVLLAFLSMWNAFCLRLHTGKKQTPNSASRQRAPGIVPFVALAWEPWLWIIMAVVGDFFEVLTNESKMVWYRSPTAEDNHKVLELYTHCTVYNSYALIGIVELLRRRGLTPVWATHATAAFALSMNASLFYVHSMGQLELEAFMHHIFILITAVTASVVLAEGLSPNRAWTFLKVVMLAVSGLWTLWIGIVIYAWHWKYKYRGKHWVLVLMTLDAAWMVIGSFVFVVVCYAIAQTRCKNSRPRRDGWFQPCSAAVFPPCTDEDGTVTQSTSDRSHLHLLSQRSYGDDPTDDTTDDTTVLLDLL